MKWVISFFDAIILCLPWYMEPPPWTVSLKEDELIHVNRPAETMKPEASFPSLLTEYRKWARQNLDRGFASHYSAPWDTDSFIENTWKIRQTIRGDNSGAQNRNTNRILKWHLALHLARELEDMQSEATALLLSSQEKGSPLKVLFEGDSNEQGGEVSDITLSLDFRQGNLSQVLEAWFGLFETCMRESPLWLTWNEEVWKAPFEGVDEKTGEGEGDFTFRMQWPDLSCCQWDELISLKQTFSHSEPFIKLRRLVAYFGKNRSSHWEDLNGLKKEVEPLLPWGVSNSRIEMHIRSIPFRATPREREKGEAEKKDFLKTLVLFRRPVME
jgi:hypothetical protein